MTRKEIKNLATKLEIPCLLHFTRATNLASITTHGLCPVSVANKRRLNPTINDQLRLDGHLDGTSLSIAFPNSQLFWKYRNDNPGVVWVVLGLDRKILWEKKCAFCRHNAADATISCHPVEELSTHEAFAGMFEEVDGMDSRLKQRLRKHDPTDVQAEVLVFDVIEPHYIVGAAFETREDIEAHANVLRDRKILVCGSRKGYFASRSYARMRG